MHPPPHGTVRGLLGEVGGMLAPSHGDMGSTSCVSGSRINCKPTTLLRWRTSRNENGGRVIWCRRGLRQKSLFGSPGPLHSNG
jgi:hypothetical protein